MKKRILAMLLAVITVFGMFAAPVSAASTLEEAMREVNIFARNTDLNWLTMNGSVKTQWYTYYIYTPSGSHESREIPAYCTDPRLYGVPAKVEEGTAIKYSASSTVTDPKVCGIISNGYPHMDLATLGLQSKEEAYYATKTALWIYLLGNWTVSGLGVNPNLTGADKAAAERVLAATKAIYTRGMAWTQLYSPKLTATADKSNAYPAMINGESVYQQIFTIDSDTWALTPVALSLEEGAPSGTKILDMDNNEVSTIRLATERTGGAGYQAKVKVVYPVSSVEGQTGTAQLVLNTTAVEYKIFYAKTLEADRYGNIQSYMLDTDPSTPVSATAISSFSAEPDTVPPTPEPGETALRIIKKETGSNTPLAGAVMQVLYPDGSVLGLFSTGTDGVITIPLTITGNYTVIEQSPPRYHLLPENPTKNATVVLNETATVTFYNDAYGSLRVEKVSDTGETLQGVTVQIKNLENGETHSAQTGPGGVCVFSPLKPGGYEVRETAGIEGWELDGESVRTATVVAGEESTVTLVNKELPGIRIVKYDRTSLQTLSSVTFEIFKDGVSLGQFRTDEMGEIVLTNLTGTIRVVEVQSVDTHITAFNEQEIELAAGDGIRQLVFFNDRRPGLYLTKVDSANLSKPIPNARFKIEAVDGSWGPQELLTGADGTIDLSGLPHLNATAYVVTELDCPGYVIDDAQRIVWLKPNEDMEFVFTNSILPSLHLLKTDSLGNLVAGTSYRLAKIEDGSRYLDRTTSSTGEILWEGLEPGVYSLVETATRSNLILDPREYHVQLFPGKTSEIVLENHIRPNLIVYKYDADTGEPIADTVFKVSAADGHSVDEIRTDRNGRATLANLLPGVYEISEKSVPEGWLMDAPSQLVTLYANRDHTAYFYDHKKPGITVRKVSSVTGDLLEGAKFHVEYASNNTTTGELNDLGYYYSGEDGTFTLTHQRDGWYKITEVAPPTGYAISEAAQEFYLAAGTTKTVTFEDVPLSALVIYKYDTVTGEAVKDAVFQLRYLTDTSGTGGTVIGRYVTSANGSFTVTGLKRGTYIVEELASDSGHVIDTAPQTAFISGSDQDVVQLYFGNAPKGSVLITKKDALTLAPLSGVEFFITDSTGAVIGNSNGYYTTDSAGTILIDGIVPGTTLIAKETRAKDGYVLDDTPQAAYIKAGQTVTLEFRNAPKGGLIVQKYDSITKEPLVGAQFKITTSSGELVPDNEGLTSSNGIYTTDAQGQIVLAKLTPDTYVVTEVKAPDNYKLDAAPQTVRVNEADTQTISFYDEPLCTLTLLKRDANTKKPLANAEFSVKYSDGTEIGANNGRYTTGKDGTVIVSGLKPDATVIVTETKAPTGYIKEPSPKTIVVRSGVANSLTFDNEPSTTLIIRKFIEGTENEPLSGVAFKVIDGSGAAVGPDDGVYYTDKAGEIVLTGLEPGTTVKAREIKTVEGFVLDGTPQDILIEAGCVQQLTFWNKRAGTLVIRKLSGADRKTPLAGAEFRLTYADGGYVDNANGKLSSNGIYRTDSNGEIRIVGVTGTIVATETRSPDGYTIGTDRTQTVVVRSGETQTLTFYNDPYQTVIVQKYIDGTTRPLAGVTFLITDGNGNPIGNGEYVTDANGRITLTAPVGTTIVARETKTVSGYVLNTTPQTITVKGGNSAQTVTMPSAAVPSAAVISSGDGNAANQLTFYDSAIGKLELVKVDAARTTKRLANVTFEIRRMDQGVVTTVTTGTDGRAVVELDAGNYYAVETRARSGYRLDNTPHYFTVTDGKTTTLTVENTADSGIEIHKIDANTGKGIYGATFLVYDSRNNVVGQYTSDDRGYVRIMELDAGTYRIRELENEGYIIDTQLKTVVVRSGEVTLVEWKNTPITGQIMVTKYAAETNAVTGQAAGTPLQGATFEIVKARNNAVVAHITTDARGIAASDPLPLGRYLVREVSAPMYWQVSAETFDVTLEFSGQIVKLAAYDKPAELGVVLTKTGIKEVLAGNKMTYTFTVANTSNVPLDSFFFHDKLPYDVTGASAITTGTYNQRMNYRILYKTNMSEYRVLASNLLTTNNYAFQLTGLPLMAGEVVTDIFYDFGTVPAGFQCVAKPTLTVSVSPTSVNGYQVINRADAGGQYGGTWETANASWITIVVNLTPVKRTPLPKTGY